MGASCSKSEALSRYAAAVPEPVASGPGATHGTAAPGASTPRPSLPRINALATAGGGFYVAACEDGALRWGLETGSAESSAWRAHAAAVTRLVVKGSSSAGGDGAGCLGASAARDGTIKLWRATHEDGAAGLTFQEAASIPDAHRLSVSALAASPDWATLASGSRDTSVALWDVATGRPVGKQRVSRPRNIATCMAWGGSGGLLYQGSEDLSVRGWDPRTLEEAIVLGGYTYFPLAAEVSPCGNYLVTGNKGFNGVGCEVFLWDVRKAGAGPLASSSSSKLARRAEAPSGKGLGHAQDCTSVVFVGGVSSTESLPLLASASKDGTVRLWSASSSAAESDGMDGGVALQEAACVALPAGSSVSAMVSACSGHETALPRLLVAADGAAAVGGSSGGLGTSCLHRLQPEASPVALRRLP